MALRVSVLVPVYKQWDLVPELLARLAVQSMPQAAFEVILADNGSPNFAAPAHLAANVKIVHCAQPGSYAARNEAARHARGDWFAFTDADCRPEADWLAALTEAAAAAGPLILAGAVDVVPCNDPPNAYEIYDMVRGIPQARYAGRGYGATANLAVPAELFRATGGFDATRLSGGDAEFCRRAARHGASVRFAPGARVKHPARATWEAIAIKSRRVLGGQVAAGSPLRRAAFLLRTLASPVISAWRFARAPFPLRSRLIAIGVQFRLWGVELAEAARLLSGKAAERR